MQTEVPTLPVVHFHAHKNINRKQNCTLERTSIETKPNSSHKNITCISSKKKISHPLLGRPYGSNARQYPTSEQSKLNKSALEQRVLSAKMLHIKELQNQLADAHYRLNELANENKLLKALQKRQDSALKRYEGTNAELPRIINSHHEELRVLQIKYKKLKAMQKESCNLLKEKENELQQLQSQNKHLLQLSKDRNLGEREKLQLQVSDLNHRIQQQQDTIQALQRKLTLETKSLKQQLQMEICKRKETQKHLLDTTEKLKILEIFLDNRERRLYCNGQLLFPDKTRRFGTQSLTNLRDIRSSSPLKISEKNKKWHTDVSENNFPEVNTKDIKENEKMNLNRPADTLQSETMVHLDQVRKYRLQKSPYRKAFMLDIEEKSAELNSTMDRNSDTSIELENVEQIEMQQNIQRCYTNARKCRTYKNQENQNVGDLLKNELAYSPRDNDSENEDSKDNYTCAINSSKQLHARLTNSVSEATKPEELTFPDCKYIDKLKVLLRERKDSYESDSEIESEIQKESIKQYLPAKQQNYSSKLMLSIHSKQNYQNSDIEYEKLTTSPINILDESQEDRNFNDEVPVKIMYTKNDNNYSQFGVGNVQAEYTKLEDSAKSTLQQTTSRGQEHDHMSTIKASTDTALFHFTEENNVPLVISNNVELADTKSEISHTNEKLYNNSRRNSIKYLLHSSRNLDNQKTDKIEVTKLKETHKNVILETCDLDTNNKLNREELRDVEIEKDSIHEKFTAISTNNENYIKTKITNYNKAKLLASIKAIDDNENIELTNQDYEKERVTNGKQIAENMFLSLPSHVQKKNEIIQDIFDNDITKTESAGSCNKLQY